MQLDKVSPRLLLKMEIKLAWEIEQDSAAKFELPIAFPWLGGILSNLTNHPLSSSFFLYIQLVILIPCSKFHHQKPYTLILMHSDLIGPVIVSGKVLEIKGAYSLVSDCTSWHPLDSNRYTWNCGNWKLKTVAYHW